MLTLGEQGEGLSANGEQWPRGRGRLGLVCLHEFKQLSWGWSSF